MRSPRVLLALPALSLALVLVGCGGDEGSDDADRPDTGFATSTESSDPDTTDTDTDTDTDETSDDSTVTTDVVTFAAPDDWLVITPEEAQDMISGDRLEENGADFLDRTGLSADQLIDAIGQFDALAVSDQGAVGGFFDNINVTTQAGGLAAPEQAEQELAELGATVQDITSEEIAGQEALVVDYVLPAGGVEIQGRALQVATGEETVIVTVSTREAATADDALDTIRDSLALVD